MHGPRHAFDDEAVREPVVLVPCGAGFVDAGVAGFPGCEGGGGDGEDKRGFAGFAERGERAGCDVVEGGWVGARGGGGGGVGGGCVAVGEERTDVGAGRRREEWEARRCTRCGEDGGRQGGRGVAGLAGCCGTGTERGGATGIVGGIRSGWGEGGKRAV